MLSYASARAARECLSCRWRRGVQHPGICDGSEGVTVRDALEAERGFRLSVAEHIDMASIQKITLSASRDIPFNKLVLSQSNVRRVKAGVSI